MKRQGKKEEKEFIKLPKLIIKEKNNSNQEQEYEDRNERKNSNKNYNNVLNKKRERIPIEKVKEYNEEINEEEEEEYYDEEEEEYDEEEEDEKTEKNNNKRINIKMKEDKNEIKEKIVLNCSAPPIIGQKNNDENKEKDKNENENQEKKEIKEIKEVEKKEEGKVDKENPKDDSQNINNQNNIEKNEDNNDKANNTNKNSKRITFKEAQQSIKEFMELLLETEEKIKSKYGNCFPDFTLEEHLPLGWQKKLLLDFFQSEEMNNISNKINEEKI